MTVWCIARLRPASRRIIRVDPDYKPIRTRIGLRYKAVPRSGQPTFSQQVILERMGFQVYMPARYEWRTVNRFTKEKEQTPIQRMPGWAFIGAPERPQWHVLKSSGVIAFFGSIDGRPVILDDASMMKLRHKFGDVTKPEVERFMRSHEEFSIGDVVSLPGGPFDGVLFEVKEICGQITKVVWEILGAQRVAEFKTWDLKRAS